MTRLFLDMKMSVAEVDVELIWSYQTMKNNRGNKQIVYTRKGKMYVEINDPDENQSKIYQLFSFLKNDMIKL